MSFGRLPTNDSDNFVCLFYNLFVVNNRAAYYLLTSDINRLHSQSYIDCERERERVRARKI